MIIYKFKYQVNRFIKFCAKKMLYFLSKFSFKKSTVSVKEASQLLDSFSPRPKGTCHGDNEYEPDYDLQIILPVYNQEKYLLTCLNSIYQQETTHSFILTIINDGSTDSSEAIIREFINKHKSELNIELINQKNKGFSGARNAGLKKIRGKYITFIDSDDYIENNFIEKLLSVDADIVQVGWYDDYGSHIRQKRFKISGYTWAKVYNSALFKDFQFPDNYYFEDVPISVIIENMDIKIRTIPNEYLYYYRKHRTSFSFNYFKLNKAIDSYYVTELSIREAQEFGIHFDQVAFENVILHFIENHKRIRYCPRNIIEAVFVLEKYLLQSYFKNYKSIQYQEFIEALETNKFEKFHLMALSY